LTDERWKRKWGGKTTFASPSYHASDDSTHRTVAAAAAAAAVPVESVHSVDAGIQRVSRRCVERLQVDPSIRKSNFCENQRFSLYMAQGLNESMRLSTSAMDQVNATCMTFCVKLFSNF
jgi:hypothetical protein